MGSRRVVHFCTRYFLFLLKVSCPLNTVQSTDTGSAKGKVMFAIGFTSPLTHGGQEIHNWYRRCCLAPLRVKTDLRFRPLGFLYVWKIPWYISANNRVLNTLATFVMSHHTVFFDTLAFALRRSCSSRFRASANFSS